MRRRVLGFVLVLGLAAWTVGAVAPAGAASKPTVPGKPTAVSGNKSARVSWPPPSNGGSPITTYLVTPYLGTRAQPARAFHSNKASEVVTGLTNGRAYTFRVAAHNAVGTGRQSAASKAVTIGLPTAPSRVRAAPGDGQATVSWAAPNNNGSAISSYTVTPFLGSVAQPAQSFHSNATSEVVTGLANSKSYTFSVAAHNAAGTGPQSAPGGAVEPVSGPALSVANATGHPNILVDAYGQAVYLYVPDGSGSTSSAGAGLESLWPVVAWSGTPTVGTGLDASKAAVHVQPDGTRQLSYNGHLLYTFLYDSTGAATGDGESSFYLLSPTGDAT